MTLDERQTTNRSDPGRDGTAACGGRFTRSLGSYLIVRHLEVTSSRDLVWSASSAGD